MMGAIEAIPDLVEPVVTWRKWRCLNERMYGPGGSIPKLYPICSNFGRPWPLDSPVKAQCHNVKRDETNDYGFRYNSMRQVPDKCSECPSPNEDNRHVGYGCGLYGYKDAETLMRDTWRAEADHWVYGEVFQWGKCYEHTAGWRSEFAQIKSLYYTNHLSVNLQSALAEACHIAKVPFLPFPDYADWLWGAATKTEEEAKKIRIAERKVADALSARRAKIGPDPS